MGLVLLNDKKISWRLKYFFSFAAFFSIAVLLLNGCRGVWLSIIICMLTIGFLLRKRHPRILAMLLILILLSAMALWFVPFLHARLITITDTHFEPNTERVLMLKSAWRMFLDHPLVGVGLDRWQYYYRHQYVSPLAHEPGVDSPHNNFAMYLDETGIIGLSAFIGLFAAVLLSLYKDFKSRSDWFALIAFSVVLGFLLGGLTDHTFRMMNVIRLMWFCVGLGSVTLDTRT
ncbi:O-antigen ligase family protein [Lucifera butyrica]|nr:O-antigen ligase family protein [Lucifera butyrica]